MVVILVPGSGFKVSCLKGTLVVGNPILGMGTYSPISQSASDTPIVTGSTVTHRGLEEASDPLQTTVIIS